jgi:hypothetical protein
MFLKLFSIGKNRYRSQKFIFMYAFPISAFVVPTATPMPPPPVEDSTEQDGGSWKQKFTPEEDTILRYLVSVWGQDRWKDISKYLRGRSVRQCRERWKYYLGPGINRSPWSAEEDRLLLEKTEEYGTKWAYLTSFFTGRTDVDVKNRFHRIQRTNRKALRKKGGRPCHLANVETVLGRFHSTETSIPVFAPPPPPPPPFPFPPTPTALDCPHSSDALGISRQHPRVKRVICSHLSTSKP